MYKASNNFEKKQNFNSPAMTIRFISGLKFGTHSCRGNINLCILLKRVLFSWICKKKVGKDLIRTKTYVLANVLKK